MTIARRTLLRATAATIATTALPWPRAPTQSAPAPLLKTIPSSSEEIPAVGLGSWITFNVGDDAQLRDECAAVIAAFFAAGGRLIDSSPMYGSAQATIGHGLKKLDLPKKVFAADKVWIAGGSNGPGQIERSRQAWTVPRFDLLQVHNLLSWEEHLQTLLAMKSEGNLRYVGITTSEGRRHRELEEIMSRHKLDFVQLSYNVLDREVEARLLPLARDRDIAVIVNRPFRQGELTRKLAKKPLPHWAAELKAPSWAALMLKFIISHPAVTCAIPATTRVDHVRENLAAASGVMLDEAQRRRIAEAVESL